MLMLEIMPRAEVIHMHQQKDWQHWRQLLFSANKSTTSSGKQLETITNAHIICLMYKLRPGSKNSDDLFTSFHHDPERSNEFRNYKDVNKRGQFL